MIETRKLANGVRIVVEKIPTVRSVSLGIWVGTGSRNESLQNNGISHFIEHMMFKGTHTYTAKQIAEMFDGIGGQINALTSKEYTCYYAKVIDQHFDMALNVLSDMFFNSKFQESEIDKERGVILEELYMYEDTPDDLVHDLISKAAFGDHSLGYAILGTKPVLETVDRQMILDYMEANYTAGNTVIAIAGNVEDSVFDKVAALFEKMKAGSNEKKNDHVDLLSGKIIVNKATEQAHICLANKGYSIGHENTHALALINNIMGGSMSSRLFQEIREERGMAYSVYSYHSAYADNGMYVSYIGTSPKHVNEALAIIQKIYRAMQQMGITQEELHKAKEQLKGMLMLSLESTTSRMNRLGKNELLLNRQISLDETIEKIEQVTLDQTREVCEEIFAHSSALAAIGPFDDLEFGRE